MDLFGVRRSNVNYTTIEFSVGNVAYTIPTGVPICEDSLYSVEIIDVLTNEQTTGLGVYYVVLVRTHVDDYIDLRSYDKLWPNREMFAADLARSNEANRKFKADLKARIKQNGL